MVVQLNTNSSRLWCSHIQKYDKFLNSLEQFSSIEMKKQFQLLHWIYVSSSFCHLLHLFLHSSLFRYLSTTIFSLHHINCNFEDDSNEHMYGIHSWSFKYFSIRSAKSCHLISMWKRTQRETERTDGARLQLFHILCFFFCAVFSMHEIHLNQI